MTRYYFDLREDDGLTVDDEGLELASLQRAQEEAARLADIARDDAAIYDGKAPHDLGIEVRDDYGPILQLGFSFRSARRRSN